MRWMLCLFLLISGCATTSYKQSPQWRGGRFENPTSWPARPGFADAFLWMTQREDDPNQHFAPPTVANDGARLRANRDRVSITWIGHATTLVQAGGVALLTDPVFVEWMGFFKRTAPPGVALEKLPPIDVVVISHNHYDHLDAATVKALGPKVQFVVPLGMAEWFRSEGLPRVTELDWWESTEVVTDHGRMRLTLTPAQHWSRRGLADENSSLWGSWLIEAGDRRIYFAGDTGYPAAFAEIGRRFPQIDYALLPIGAYAPRWFMSPVHMSPEDAAQAFADLHARYFIPIHWATFELSDEPMDEPPILLRKAMRPVEKSLLLLKIGETWWDPKTEPESAKQ